MRDPATGRAPLCFYPSRHIWRAGSVGCRSLFVSAVLCVLDLGFRYLLFLSRECYVGCDPLSFLLLSLRRTERYVMAPCSGRCAEAHLMCNRLTRERGYCLCERWLLLTCWDQHYVSSERWSKLLDVVSDGIGRCTHWAYCVETAASMDWNKGYFLVVEVVGRAERDELMRRLHYPSRLHDDGFDPLVELFDGSPEDLCLFETSFCRLPCCMEVLREHLHFPNAVAKHPFFGDAGLGSIVDQELKLFSDALMTGDRDMHI
ncbi:hypothetical protein V8C35DRAFT_131848 [Trichoderma chlorosporum]